MKNIITTLILLSLISCSNIEFVYVKDKDVSPLYGKTQVYTSGTDIVFLNSYIRMFFGEGVEEKYNLSIKISEKKIKRSVEKNQAISNLDYELKFTYILINNEQNCIIYNKEILSSFSVSPKSSGYNYGTDASLEKKYELAINDNLNKFLSFVTRLRLNSCK